MALTVSLLSRSKTAQTKINIASIAFDDSYPTGGEGLTGAQLGLVSVDSVQIEPAGGYVFSYDYANKKVIAYYGDNDAVADGALAQVADKADLSAITTKVIATGK